MDIGKSFSFMFKDDKWIEKLLIGGVILLVTIGLSWTVIIPILGAALLYGYFIQVVRNAREDADAPLPAWDAWGHKIGDGIKLFVLQLIWAIPLFIFWALSLMSIAVFQSGSEGFGGFLGTCISCLVFLYMIFYYLALPGITIRYAETSRISDGLDFSAIWDFTRENVGQIIIVAIIVWLVGMFASFIGLLLCGIGIGFTMFWAGLVQYYLYAGIGKEEKVTSVDAAATEYLADDDPAAISDSSAAVADAPADETATDAQDAGDAGDEPASDEGEAGDADSEAADADSASDADDEKKDDEPAES